MQQQLSNALMYSTCTAALSHLFACSISQSYVHTVTCHCNMILQRRTPAAQHCLHVQQLSSDTVKTFLSNICTAVIQAKLCSACCAINIQLSHCRSGADMPACTWAIRAAAGPSISRHTCRPKCSKPSSTTQHVPVGQVRG